MADPVLTVVTGALRSSINDHGPITDATLPSAAKRLAGQLRSLVATEINGDTVWKRKAREVQHGHRILVERHERLRARLDAVRALHVKVYDGYIFGDVCQACSDDDARTWAMWPCSTIQAIDGAVTDDAVHVARYGDPSGSLRPEST